MKEKSQSLLKKFAFSIDFQILHFCSRVSRFSIFARNLSPTFKVGSQVSYFSLMSCSVRVAVTDITFCILYPQLLNGP